MICKNFANLYNKLWDCKLVHKRHSALFISAAKATDTFAYITPHVDFEEVLKNKETLAKNLSSRKAKFDLNKLENLYHVYSDLKTRLADYTKKKDEISRELGKLIKNDPTAENIDKLKIHSNLLKENIKKLKSPLWSAEEVAILEFLKLPNSLHSQTPIGDCKVLHSEHLPPKTKKDHLEIAREQNIVKFTDNTNYYLLGKSAVFELGAKFYFSSILKDSKFIQFSNPDFVKSLVIEGCGSDHVDPDATFILHHNEDSKVNPDNRLHLTGGGSLFSYMAYHAKNVVYSKALPLKYFAMGRQYLPSAGENNLFNSSQASVISLFGVTRTNEELNILLDEVIEVLKKGFGSLGYHFRLCLVQADRLKMWESLRVAIEMYSTSQERYIEVGNVSLSGDYLSKRLMFTFTENKENKFPHIISGTLLNVPRFLACVLEQDGEFDLPEQFNVHNWINK